MRVEYLLSKDLRGYSLKIVPKLSDHQIETSKRPATEVRQSLLSTAQTHHPFRILALLDLSPRWWVLFLPPFFISTGHETKMGGATEETFDL